MKRKELLEEAAKITNGERQDHYGTPENNFSTIADLWNVYETACVRRQNCAGLETYDVAAMMILLKVARIGSDPKHIDSWIDIAGYASCGGEIVSG